ncbi:cytochrome d ubiquinol oxidase subunit II [Micromonospora endophytica]|uniref:Cytochrome D ubiquinol oxidase subunit II n=1 Tax=Micromonospora endophytica TaxID=515350 RepID=A0A2W2C5U9_9ACTN|nr:cytochrome d ubiquinol oxidase subunit II [Micromonospora endophytica]PZF87358.1 cytochrome D ubiquinol oxidase subunit II [Micromonospora endophytica]RIW43759.1 cytochrome d ubiquinol oxidase subunit II [Micromonospora endophytica]BCJ58630.1 cytochrome bd oxidase subunit II [Micromonospora endophytica]
MALAWYALLGLFFAGYLVLGGYDYGVGLLLARDGDPARRRAALTALGPFFLGNEVWLVAAVGILFGAFPMLEGELLAGSYPAVATALAGVILVTTGVQLRSRPTGRWARTGWDRVIAVGSLLAALGWGVVLAGLLQGVPRYTDGHVAGVTHLFTPFAAAVALALVALVAAHGATFLTLRLPVAEADRLRPLARRLAGAAIVAVTAAAAVGLLSARVRDAAQQPLVGVLLGVALVAALLLARAALGRRRTAVAFAATATALVLPVVLVGATLWPYVLVSTVEPGASLTVADAAASAPTLRLLGWLAVPLLPALLGFQAMCFWIFRGRTDGRAPVYW